MELKERNRLLRIRKVKNSQRPTFARFESWRYKKLKKSGWRKQRGIDNKTRRKMKMGVKSPEPGYRGPKNTRGLHPLGIEDVRIMHIKDLENLNPKFHGIRIAKRLGARKKMALIEEARDRGFHILNMGISKDDLFDIDSAMDDEDFEEEAEEQAEPEQDLSRKAQIKKLKEQQETVGEEAELAEDSDVSDGEDEE